jgi:hypothetical protein
VRNYLDNLYQLVTKDAPGMSYSQMKPKEDMVYLICSGTVSVLNWRMEMASMTVFRMTRRFGDFIVARSPCWNKLT